MSHDPTFRRETPLGAQLAERIRREGPISVHDYMQACLYDPAHGFYRSGGVIGREGDFITAPEISQIFGELIGLWCVVVRRQMGWPARLTLIELGPGRGTLMRDALRASRTVPGFLDGLDVVLVETNTTLVDVQARTLAGCGVPFAWRERLPREAAGAVILIANEFLDCLPIGQAVRTPSGWSERRVGLDAAGRLIFITGGDVDPPPQIAAEPNSVPVGEVCEWADFSVLRQDLGAFETFAGLFIDYGDTMPGRWGDSLQAVRRHEPEHPLTSPGEADLTAHVDFAAFRRAMTADGLFETDGPVTQATFLGRLGAVERASRLMAANPSRTATIETGVARLLAPVGMGSRFKCAGVRSRGLPPLPAFD